MNTKTVIFATAVAAATSVAVTFIVLYATNLSDNADQQKLCGGSLEGDYGKFRYDGSSQGSNCLWIIRLTNGYGIRLTVDELQTELNVYPDGSNSNGTLTPLILNKTHVGSAVDIPGKYLLLTGSAHPVAFTWESVEKSAGSAVMSSVTYMDSQQGHLEWRPQRQGENLTWAINAQGNLIAWKVKGGAACDAEEKCSCFHFSVHQTMSDGNLQEMRRVCGGGSELGEYENLNSHLIIYAWVNSTDYASVGIEISWPITASPEPTSPPGAATTTTTGPALPAAAPKILLAPVNGGMQIIHLETGEVTRVASPSSDVRGVSYHSKGNKIFWYDYEPDGWRDGGSNGKFKYPYSVYSADMNGIGAQLLHESVNAFDAIDYDWITENLYLCRTGGLTVCNATSCEPGISLRNMTDPAGLALDPRNGLMYWTSRKDEAIWRAGMDGSDPEVILSNVKSPMGITIDFQSSRLYWTSFAGDSIETSDLNGMDYRVVIFLVRGSHPYGIGMFNGALYWSNQDLKTVQTCPNVKECQAVELHNAGAYLRDMTVIHETNQPRFLRRNDCAGMGCSHKCVLAKKSSRCICPTGWQLDEDKRTCLKN